MTNDEPQYDVIVAGGGMVGGLLAASLAGTRLRVGVLEPALPAPFLPGSNPDYDLRVSAVNRASIASFERASAWRGVRNRRAAPFRRMVVWDGEAGGRTVFDAREAGQPELGFIVENRVLQLALLDVLKSADNITLLCPASLASFSVEPSRVVIHLETGDRLSSRLLVGADGARSRVRDHAGIIMLREAYPQHALVATIETHLPQQSVTWQRFVPSGPQAFLPLCGNRASMVWYHTEDEVKRLCALDDGAFADEMQLAFPEELGGIDAVLDRGSFPIAKAHAGQYVADRVALVGDAAHTVHPLAGQGVNLGMADAACLSRVILESVQRGHDPGLRRHLRPYERERRPENALMIEVLDGFFHAFKPQPRAVRTLRSAAMTMADSVPLIKQRLMRQALGV